MGTLSRRDFWKKRAVYGYKPSYVQALIDTKQTDFDKQKKNLEDELELLNERNKRLKAEEDALEEQKNIHDTQVSNKEMIEALTQTYLKGLSQHLELIDALNRQKKDNLRRLEEKQIERDKLVSRLKDVMQDLHFKIGEMGED